MRLAVVGSRDFPRLELVDSYLNQVNDQEPLECIVSGGARGVDRRAELWAAHALVPVVSFRPEKIDENTWLVYRWTTAGPGMSGHALPAYYPSFAAAAFVRNGFIIEFADSVVAFNHAGSRGTADSISKARELGNLRDVIHG